MPTKPLLLAALISLAATLAHADSDAVVAVSYKPQGGRFFDAGDMRVETERVEKTLTEHFQALGKKWLAPGSQLSVEVTEIDLAGRIPPSSINRLRVLGSGADWPRIVLNFELVRADGQTERGEASVTDMNYMMNQPYVYSSDSLAYEKRMLDNWFRQRFAQPPG
ncbi:DUF3016 domain-containing protein [Sphaerotilaceae bacterium SBD11-9]